MPSPEVWRREAARSQARADARRAQPRERQPFLARVTPWMVAVGFVVVLSLVALVLYAAGVR